MGGAFWEARIDAANWPSYFVRRRHRRGKRPSLPAESTEESLIAFVCLPSRYLVEDIIESIGGIPPCSHCNSDGVAEAVPLLLAYHHGRYEDLSHAAMPMEVHFNFGERAASEYPKQLIHYHTLAVQDRRRLQAEEAIGVEGADSNVLLSAAVCVVGLARTLSSPEVFLSVAKHVTSVDALGAEASLFFVLDTGGQPLSEFGEAFGHLPPTGLAVVNETSWGKPQSCGSTRDAVRLALSSSISWAFAYG